MYIIMSGALYDVRNGVQKEFRSPFAEEFFEEESKSWGNEAWKYKQSDGDSPQDLISRSMVWGGRGKVKPPVPVKFMAVFETQERLYYVLEMRTSCGLFYYDFAREQETRLFHRTEFRPRGLHIAEDGAILTTVASDNGTVHLAQYDPNGKREQVLTSGDCRDENPFCRGDAVYYQSSGLARDAEGRFVAAGPVAINKLDLKTGDIETILSSEKFDYLLPHIAGDGTLYCIRAPYHIKPVYALKDRLLDILFFPWKMCIAIFAFLNVFSLFFANKPLTTAGAGANPKQADVSRRILHNRIVNLQETWKKEGKKVAVSKDWKLIRRTGDQTTEIACNVLWFDLDQDDNPVYTDGYSLYDSTGKTHFKAEDLVSCLTAPRNRTGAIVQ